MRKHTWTRKSLWSRDSGCSVWLSSSINLPCTLCFKLLPQVTFDLVLQHWYKVEVGRVFVWAWLFKLSLFSDCKKITQCPITISIYLVVFNTSTYLYLKPSINSGKRMFGSQIHILFSWWGLGWSLSESQWPFAKGSQTPLWSCTVLWAKEKSCDWKLQLHLLAGNCSFWNEGYSIPISHQLLKHRWSPN